MLLPSSVGFMTVRAQAIEVLADSIDTGSEPDGRAIVATVEFAPSFRGALTVIPDNVIVVPTSITCTLNADGKLIPPSDGEDTAGTAAADLFLIAPQQSSLSNQNWTWTATFRPIGTPKWTAFAIGFSGAPAEIVNLTTLASIPPDTGTTLQAWLLAVSDAEDARDAAAVSAAAAETARLASVAAAASVPTPAELNATIAAELDVAVPPRVDSAITSADIPGKVATQIAAQSGKVVTGSGVPNGVLTAGVGTLYVDTASTLGVSIWRKATGTGSTGWTVTEGDTGWRNVTASILPAAASQLSRAEVRRVGNTVEWSIRIDKTGSGFFEWISVANGFRFRPSIADAQWVLSGNAGTLLIITTVTGGITLAASSTAAVAAASLAFSHTTDDSWPTILPGTAA